jgi:hypothetical protein
MSRKIAIQGEFFPTNITLEGLLTSMNTPMFEEVSSQRESLPTYLTAEVFVTVMYCFIFITTSRKCFP